MYKYLSILLLMALAGSVHAGEVHDLGSETPPTLPATVGSGNQPVYITNSAAEAKTGEIASSLSVESGASLHIGYDRSAVAAGDIGVSITGSLLVGGNVMAGKSATPGRPGRPEAATTAGIQLDITEQLVIDGGAMEIHASPEFGSSLTAEQGILVSNGSLSLYGSGAAGGTTAVSGRSLSVNNGEVYIGSYSSVKTTLDTVPGSTAQPEYSVAIGQGGRLIVNSGGLAQVAPGVPGEEPTPTPGAGAAGLDVSAGGAGVYVGAYGILSTGMSGGMIAGMGPAAETDPTDPAQRLVVAHTGTLDTSRGSLSVSGMEVQISGTYMAGYNASTDTINALTNTDSAIVVESTGTISFSKDLQRALNRMDYHSVADSTILSGSAIRFVNGLPVILSVMGDYYLAMDASDPDGLENLWVRRVENEVTGSNTAADKSRFSSNFGRVWNNNFLSPDFTNAVYAVSGSETPIEPVGTAGALTAAAFDAFVAGPGAPIGTHGIADAGVMEFYVGGSQYGPAAIAMSTATELGHAMYSRINQATNEAYRFGSIASSDAYAFYDPGEVYSRRIWAGGFGRREEADPDHGIAGFKYEPSGVVLGYDALCGPFILGGALAYGKGDYKDKAASDNDSTISGYSAGLYGGVHYTNGLIATAHASYTYMDNDMADYRGGMKRTADYSTDVWSLGARVAYETNPAERLTLTPSIGLTRTEAKAKSHTERLAGEEVLRIDKLSHRSTMVPIDVAISWDVFCSGSSLFRLGANLGYAYEFDNDGLTGDLEYYGLPGVAPVSVAEREPGRNRFNFGFGFLYSGSKIDLTGEYDYFRRTGHNSHQLKGSLGVKF